MEPRICIVDDDEAIRDALRMLLFAEGFNSEAFASADDWLNANDHDWHCMLLDIRMPGTDGLQLFRRLREQACPFPVIFITGHGDIPLAVSAIKQGAFDFLTKPFRDGEILSKVQAALEDYGARISEKREIQELNERYSNCTQREQEVMTLMVAGRTNRQIADELDISPRTVEIHRAKVMQKMSADSLPALVRMAAQLEDSL